MSEVLRLATAVAARVLEAQIMQHQIATSQVTALMRTAGFLKDHNVPWPPLLEQVLHELADDMAGRRADIEAAKAVADDNGPVTGLTRFMAAFRREKGYSEES
ncbi:hypothetical protein [Methylobacterium sp. yr668]|uniref:hypothetical protein n=1 Tax=Methylobacterium sp. yr668 TaxID=1761801 RepID=UPI0008DF6E17|nr:hypothetical protein [Methylobacterium sp. yr668]SFT24730.1 hypothetical protein SAMN04487845_13056 [Methylobacterium sp. yr668]